MLGEADCLHDYQKQLNIRKGRIQQNHDLLHLNTRLSKVNHHSLWFFPTAFPIASASAWKGRGVCLSRSGPQSWDSQHRVMAIVMVLLWHIHFLPAVTTRKEPLAERVSASFKLYICSRLSVQKTWDAISPSPCAGICFLVLFVLKGLGFRKVEIESLWMKMPLCILKRKEVEMCSLHYQH